MVKRVKTGIRGFDELVQGGFPIASTILLTGSPGTGKTIFGLQFLYNGASKFNEKGLYVTFEQTERALVEQAKLFGWDFEKYLKNKSIQILHISTREINQQNPSLRK